MIVVDWIAQTYSSSKMISTGINMSYDVIRCCGKYECLIICKFYIFDFITSFILMSEFLALVKIAFC